MKSSILQEHKTSVAARAIVFPFSVADPTEVRYPDQGDGDGPPHLSDVHRFENLISGRRRVARHATLYREQAIFEKLYIVRYGQFKMISHDVSGREHIAQIFMAGDLLGLDAISTGRHHFRVGALENSEVSEIPFSAVTNAMRFDPFMMRHVLQLFGNAITVLHERFILHSGGSLDRRFAGFLLYLGDKYARLGYSDKSFRLAMSRSDIASFLGTTSESVSRIIARFNSQGAVLISGRSVELKSREFLLEFVNCGNQTAALTDFFKIHPIDTESGELRQADLFR
jgi:CRP/FNR family transcriptional regulator